MNLDINQDMSQIYHSFTEIFANNFPIKEFSLQLKFSSFIMLSRSHNLGNIGAGGLNLHSNDSMFKRKASEFEQTVYIFLYPTVKHLKFLFLPHQHFYIFSSKTSAYFFHIEKEAKL